METAQGNKTVKQLSLLAITWPIFIELFLHMLMGSTDTFMLSHISNDAVAAVGVANQLIYFTILLFGFISTGTTVLVAQNLGAGNQLEAKKISAISLTVNLVLGIIVSIVLVVFNSEFLKFFSLEPHLSGLAEQYLAIVGGTIFTQALLLTASSILRAYGFSRQAMYVSLIMNIIHLIGNSIFIYGLLGVPQMGVTGVAISTAVSKFIALILIIVLLYKILPIRMEKEDYLNINKIYIKKIMKIGVPAAGEQVSYNSSQMVITAIIALLGASALATRIYTWNFMAFILLFGLAMGQGTQILIGHKVGAGDFEGTYRQLMKSLKISFLMTIIISIPIVAFRENLLSIFTDDQWIIAEGSKLLLLCLILEPGRTFNLVVINSLRAAGDAVFPMKMAIVSMWGLCVPIAYFLGIVMEFGLPGIWIAFIIDEWFRGIVMYFRWKSRAWEKKILVDTKISHPA